MNCLLTLLEAPPVDSLIYEAIRDVDGLWI